MSVNRKVTVPAGSFIFLLRESAPQVLARIR
jgi:hypothetical protein